MDKFKNPLAVKALIAIVIMLLPITVTFFWDYAKNKAAFEEHVLSEVTVIAELSEGLVYQFLEMSKRRAVDFSSDGFIRDSLSLIVKGDTSKVSALNDHLVRNKISLDDTISAIYVVSLSGLVVSSTDYAALGLDFSERHFFTHGLTAPGVVDTGGLLGLPSIAAFAPITKRSNGEPIGVMVNLISLAELNKVLNGEFSLEYGALTQNEGKKKTMESYLVNSDKLFITESMFIEDAEFNQLVDTPPVNVCLQGSGEMTGHYTGYRGVDVVGAAMCLPHMKWVLLVEVDKTDVYSSTELMLRDAILTGILVLVFMFALFIFFIRYVVGPVKEISDAAKKIGHGDFSVTVPVRTNDEIGMLASSFNTMARDIEKGIAEVKESRESLTEAQKIAHLGNWNWNIETNELRWSEEIYSIFGLEPGKSPVTYEAFMQAVHPEDRELVSGSVAAAVENDVPYNVDHRILQPDGEERVVHEQGIVYRDSTGKPLRMTGTVQDITDRKKTEFELRKLSMAIDNSINIVFITDIKGLIEYVNPTFEKVTGFTRDEALGKSPKILASGETTEAEYKNLWETILRGNTWRGTFKNRSKTGEIFWCSSVVSPIKDDTGEIAHFLAIQEDITERMQSEEVIKYMAWHDDLTGLYNRLRFIYLVDEWISKASTKGSNATVIILDIDQFKMINNTYGHGLGDELLVRIAKLIDSTVQESTAAFTKNASEELIISRLSGDEFAIFIPYLDISESAEVAENLRATVESFSPTEVASHLTISVGMVLYPEHGTNARKLLSRADASMYRAKEMGRNRCHLYRPEDHILEDMHTRLKWKEKIIEALDNDRFEPWYQPIMDLETGEISHYEALVRMFDETGNILLPGEFIEVAERFGMIDEINKVVVEKTTALLADITSKGRDVNFAINLSGKMIGDEKSLEMLHRTISSTGVDPSRIIFEITETATVQDMDKAVKFIDNLKAIGCKFALDDFGVGFTSFLYLRELNVDFIKIDGSFIRKLNTNKNDQLFVKALSDIARGMGIKTVAEFVENEETMEMLKKFGVDYAQGYHIGKPAPFN
jgi:diguanylate cyclase (GGDEF)-like protein/PAS domain S-box-containing protein